MRILVTGGAGFIGSHVVRHALEAGHEVSVLDDLSLGRRENVPDEARLHVVDLRDREAVARTVDEARPEVVCHHAAQASVTVSMRDPLLDAQVNVIGSLHLLDACAAAGVGRFVFASSGGAMYGEVADGALADEDARPLPKSPYAIGKLYFEQLLQVHGASRGLAINILRYANVYGPRQDARGEAGVVAKFITTALAGEPLVLHARRLLGDDGCVRDYVFVDDVARLNLLCIDGRVSAPLLNVGTGIGTTTLELAREIFALLGCDTGLSPAPPRTGDLERSVLDARRALALLGELTPLARGLERTRASFDERLAVA